MRILWFVVCFENKKIMNFCLQINFFKFLFFCAIDAKGRVLSLPPIINSDHSKISLNTKNVLIEVTVIHWLFLNDSYFIYFSLRVDYSRWLPPIKLKQKLCWIQLFVSFLNIAILNTSNELFFVFVKPHYFQFNYFCNWTTTIESKQLMWPIQMEPNQRIYQTHKQNYIVLYCLLIVWMR